MRKVWVVVANRSAAHFYISEKDVPFVLHHTIEHPEGHFQEHELVSDKSGKESNRAMYSSSMYEGKSSAVKNESIHFAKQIADFLSHNHNLGAFERLYLIAPPSFISDLREALPSTLSNLVYQEIPKNLIQFEAAKIRAYLPPVL